MTTGRAIVSQALKLIGVVGMGAPLTSENASDGLFSLNLVLDQWSLMPLTIPVTAREVFPLAAGRGGPSDPYTIGPGGDFDTVRPTSISNVGLYDTGSSGPFEIPRSLFTNDGYASIVMKELTSTYFNGLWFSPTSTDGWAQIQLYPVPSGDDTSLVLYLPKQLRQFVDLNDQYDFPPGAVSALMFETAKWLAPQYGQPWTGQLDALCNQAMAVYQRGNTIMADLGLDAALVDQAGLYNALTDATSGPRGR